MTNPLHLGEKSTTPAPTASVLSRPFPLPRPYDVAKEVEPGGSVAFDVPADIAGIFEAELEDSEQQIARVTVRP